MSKRKPTRLSNETLKRRGKRVVGPDKLNDPHVTYRGDNLIPHQSEVGLEDKTIRELLDRTKHYFNEVSKYPDEIKCLALSLRSSGYKLGQISQIIGAQPNTIHDWLNNPKFDSVRLRELAENLKDQLADRFIIGASTSLSTAMTDEKLEKASYYQLVMGSAVMTDKARLLSGESTENYSVMSKKVIDVTTRRSKADQEMDGLEAEILRLKSGKS